MCVGQKSLEADLEERKMLFRVNGGTTAVKLLVDYWQVVYCCKVVMVSLKNKNINMTLESKNARRGPNFSLVKKKTGQEIFY